ncbi:DEAD/DEAH box helicase family protein [Paraeggerthella sp. Marseille-Q4926]|uniref:DEAD/DEAH box helicase family protein n=1 Tax=Paraeggerthella sp. Marseille-Q4926 TaxID=2866587 RepID=UPI001CE444FB|nr:DEAD/DEAH box helicase family protein [Paraeggerthella sp. Marseille-Q4926]
MQEECCLPPTNVLSDGRPRDFTVEIETGTGKTCVYVRSVYELNRRCGITKFVIVVPSVAIREGVIKSFQTTRKHFEALYARTPLDCFVYDSKDVGPVDNFAMSSSIQVVVINIDDFNKGLDEDGIAKEGDLFHRCNEKLIGGFSPRELVSE